MKTRLTIEEQAARLAEWLEQNPGSPPPQDVDPDVIEAIFTLRPDLAPAPRLLVDEILAEIKTGPFATPVDLAVERERRIAPVRPGSISLRRWAWPGAGLALAAALALFVVLPTPDSALAPVTTSARRSMEPPVDAPIAALEADASRLAPPLSKGSEAAGPQQAPSPTPAMPGTSTVIAEAGPLAAIPDPVPAQEAKDLTSGNTASTGTGGAWYFPWEGSKKAESQAEAAPSEPSGLFAAHDDAGAAAVRSTVNNASAGGMEASDQEEEPSRPSRDEMFDQAEKNAPMTGAFAAREYALDEDVAAPDSRLGLGTPKATTSAAPTAPIVVDRVTAQTSSSVTRSRYTIPEAGEASAFSGDDANEASLDGLRASATPLDYRKDWASTDASLSSDLRATVLQAYTDSEARAVTGDLTGALAILAPLLNTPSPAVNQDAAWRTATLQMRQGKPTSALSTVNRALKADSRPTVFRSRLLALAGNIQEELGHTEEAREAYQQATDANGQR